MMQRVTRDAAANEQLLYFTSNSVTSDGRTLFFLSDAGGHANLWAQDLQSGERRQLSQNSGGVLKSYVYFRGIPYEGLGKASVCLDGERRVAYYLQGRGVYRVGLDARPEEIARLPRGQMTAFTHVSADGRLLCVPTTDERALAEETPLPRTSDGCGKLAHDIDERVQRESLASTLHVFDTATGEEVQSVRVPRAWVTHVQFSPTDDGAILYNHEWPAAQSGIRRMWLYRDGGHTRLREAGQGRDEEDWTCHEMWEPDGRHVVYHGGYTDGGYYLGRVGGLGGGNVEVRLPQGYATYGHFTLAYSHPGWLVTDGYYTRDGEKDWISRVHVDWETGRQRWVPLCRHGSAWATQDAHPHPVFDPLDEYVYFTGQDRGMLAVCRVPAGWEADVQPPGY